MNDDVWTGGGLASGADLVASRVDGRSMVEFVELQDVQVPAMGCGTWQLRGEACRDGVHHALELGYRHVDTARMYRNEAEVDAGIAEQAVVEPARGEHGAGVGTAHS